MITMSPRDDLQGNYYVSKMTGERIRRPRADRLGLKRKKLTMQAQEADKQIVRYLNDGKNGKNGYEKH